MKANLLEILAKISLIIFSFLILYYFVQGVTTKPWEGDSVAYHIPIANLILSGKIVNPALGTYPASTDFYRLYQPGSAEVILSVFEFLKVPLNLFNVVGVIVFFFVMFHLARSFELSRESSILFATSLASLHLTMRWILSQTVDIWLAIFLGLSIILMRNPRKTWKYFLTLGAVLGILFGSKYSAPAYTFFVIILFGRQVLRYLNLKRLVAFLVPFSVLGLSWYIRNLILTGDPYFPQTIPFFKGIPYHVLDDAVWKMFIYFRGGPIIWIQSAISEYTVWCLVLLAAPFIYIWTRKRVSTAFRSNITKLLILSLLSFIVYLLLPSGPSPSLITSVFRYTYPVFIPLILCIFIYAKRFKKEEVLGVIAVTNMLIMPELSYHPKILIALIPIALLIFYPSKVQTYYKSIKKNYSHKRS